MFKRMAELVHEQEYMTQRIDSNITQTSDNLDMGEHLSSRILPTPVLESHAHTQSHGDHFIFCRVLHSILILNSSIPQFLNSSLYTIHPCIFFFIAVYQQKSKLQKDS